jgi:hypothetical protein
MQYEYIGTHDIYFWITYEKYWHALSFKIILTNYTGLQNKRYWTLSAFLWLIL